jgi:protein-disulfide isomerase/uncharacterized membrane protein
MDQGTRTGTRWAAESDAGASWANDMHTRLFKTFVLFGVLILALGGGMISNHLVALRAPIRTAAQTEALKRSIWTAICGGEQDGEADGCTQVMASRYGTIPVPWFSSGWVLIPIPVAQVALCYYIFMGLWFLFTGVPALAGRRWHLLPFLLALFSVAAAPYFISTMAWRLQQWCRLCMALHGINALLLVGVILLWPRRSRAEADAADAVAAADPPMSLRLVAATLVAALAFCGASFLQRGLQGQMKTLAQQVGLLQKEFEEVSSDERLVFNAFLGTEPVTIPIREDAAALGPADAAHTVVLFSDLQCPHCKRFENTFEQELRGLWDGQVRLIFRHYPLCAECNRGHPATFERPAGLHPQACEAAAAVEAARLQGGPEAFWKMHDRILEHQEKLPELGPDGLANLAAEIGLDGARLRADMSGETVRKILERDVEDALSIGVRSTPSAFLNGRYLTPLQRGSKVFWTRASQSLLGKSPGEPETADGKAPAAPAS